MIDDISMIEYDLEKKKRIFIFFGFAEGCKIYPPGGICRGYEPGVEYYGYNPGVKILKVRDISEFS